MVDLVIKNGWVVNHNGTVRAGIAVSNGKVVAIADESLLPSAKKITYRISMKRVILRKLVMGIADAVMEVDGRDIYAGKDLQVGLFTSTDGF